MPQVSNLSWTYTSFMLIFSLLLVFSNTYFISFIMGKKHILSTFKKFKFFFLV